MNKLGSFLLSFLIKLVGWLPLGLARWIGGLLGSMAYTLNTRGAHVTRVNLSLCYPKMDEKSRERLCKESLIETGKTGSEICFAWTRSAHDIAKRFVDVEGEQLIKRGLEQGKGVVILAPHLGNWEILGHYLTSLGPVMNLFQPPKNAALGPTMLEGRTRNGSLLAPTNAKGVASLLKHLRRGGICGILPDQVPLDSSSGVFAPFFGHAAHTITLPQKLIQKNNSTALLAFAKREPEGFKIIFRPVPDNIYSPDTLTAATALNEGIEHLIAEAPAQYQWEYKRFRARPTKESKDPYTG